MNMLDEIKMIQDQAELLYSAQQIEQAITKMAKKISLLLDGQNPLVLCVLNGGMIITGQLIRHLQFPLTLDALHASRYRNTTTGSHIEWILKPTSSLKDRTVLIVDDILDQGFTLQAVIEYCQQQGTRSIYSAVLLEKILDSEKKPVTADFVALQVPDRYVFGYGMDYKGYLRNAAGIYACRN